MKLLVTGGAGFIGSCFVRLVLEKNSQAQVTTLDALTYAGHQANLQEVSDHPRHQFIEGNICNRDLVEKILREQKPDAVVNFAAESHVDRSIAGPDQFVLTNVVGTQVLLESARKVGLRRFLQISTDEVYGSLDGEGEFQEDSSLQPSNPYSASKAAGDLLCLSYFRTYGFPVLITRSSNAYGPYQFPEKLIPVLIEKAIQNEALPLYGNGQNVRTWIHVRDNSEAILQVLEKGDIGRVYHISSNDEWRNIDIAQMILNKLGKDENQIQFIQDRPGHDWRYALNCQTLKEELHWQSQIPFEKGIQETIEWYQANGAWLDTVKKKAATSPER